MRTGRFRLVLAFFLWGIYFSPALAAETMYVKTNGTELRAETARAKVLTKLQIDTPVLAKRFHRQTKGRL